MFVITLITEAVPSGPTWMTGSPIASSTLAMLREDGLVASRDHRDLARGRLVDAAGDGALERPDAAGRRDRGQALELVRVVRAHVDPRTARPQALEHAVGAGDDLADGSGRRQARDHAVGGLRDGPRRRGRIAPAATSAATAPGVADRRR